MVDQPARRTGARSARRTCGSRPRRPAWRPERRRRPPRRSDRNPAAAASTRSDQRRIAREPFGDEVRCALRVAHLVGRDVARSSSASTGSAARSASRRKKYAARCSQSMNSTRCSSTSPRREVAPLAAAAELDELVVGDRRLEPGDVEVRAERMEVLEALVHLEADRGASVDVVPEGAKEAGEVHRVERLDERRIAHAPRGCRAATGRARDRPRATRCRARSTTHRARRPTRTARKAADG